MYLYIEGHLATKVVNIVEVDLILEFIVKNKFFPKFLINRLLFILLLRSTFIPDQVSISICTCTNIFFFN